MKKILGPILTLSALFCLVGPLSAASEAEYHSDASTTFYGKYVEKDQPDHSKRPGGTHTGGGSSGSHSSGNTHSNTGGTRRPGSNNYQTGSTRGTTSSGSSSKIIPRTGNTSQKAPFILGITALISSVVLVGKGLTLKK